MDDVITGDGWAVSTLDRLGDGPGFRKIRTAAGRDGVRHERDRAAARHRDRAPLPRAPAGGLLPARGAHRDGVRRRRDADARGGRHRARRPVDGAQDPQRRRRRCVYVVVGGADGYVGRDGHVPGEDQEHYQAAQ